MQPPDRTPAPIDPESDARATDYGADLTETESQAVSMPFDPQTTRRLKRAAVIFVVVLAVAFVLVRIDRYFKDRAIARTADQALAAPRAVDVIEAKRVGSVERFVLPGQTAAWHQSTIYARVNGYVARWLVDIGDHVHKGQLLAVIETPELDAELAAARAQLKASEAQVLVRRAETQFSKSTYERWRDSPKGVVSEQEREEKHADYDSAVARLKSAEAQVALDQARVNQYAALSEFKQVTAPFDGVIADRNIDIGNLVTAGSTSTTSSLYVLTQNDPIRIFVDVPQSAAADLMQGHLPVGIQTSDGATRAYTGHVERAAGAINAQARTLRIEVDIANPDQTLVPGMYVKVAFGLQPKGLVQIPAAALLFRASGPQVARVTRAGRIEFREVTIARDDGAVVELASGVAPGDRLALNLSSQIGAGDQVKINDVDASAPHPPPLTASEH
jgi:membrane fusion protein, multidrug efflux system